MTDVTKIMENLNTAMVACDTDFKVLYANERCKEVFRDLLKIENFVGNNMVDCHKPETMDKLKVLFEEYKQKTRKLDYYTMETPDGLLTIVNVPFYEDGTFAGVVEYIFEGALG
jgi:transcriptional regulator with PAS, ATPase and Fis domain